MHTHHVLYVLVIFVSLLGFHIPPGLFERYNFTTIILSSAPYKMSLWLIYTLAALLLTGVVADQVERSVGVLNER